MEVDKTLIRPLSDFYNHFYDQYADSAGFLWMLRSQAVDRPDYRLDDIDELDQRLENELDGLMSSPEDAWVICESALSFQQAPEVFVASVIAFRCMDINKIKIVVEAGMIDDQCFKGLVSALAWLPGRLVHSWVKKFLRSKDLNHKTLALAVCSARREDPRDYLSHILNREDCREHEFLHARALRLIGELKRFDLIPALQRGAKSDSALLRFWALRSLILLGDRAQALQLEEYLLIDNPLKLDAIFIAFRVLPCSVAKNWISALSQEPNNNRFIIQSVSVLGDPEVINWLIGQMQIPELSRISAEAFSTITGIDLKAHQLILENLPDLDNQLPETEDENDFVELNHDDYLPFPDFNKIAAVWQQYQHRFKPGSRYFMGHLLTQDQTTWAHLRNILEHGTQPQRAAAAMELSLMDASQYLFNHVAKGIHHE
jgi:uncharacterized protein (TIGR02270 family)